MVKSAIPFSKLSYLSWALLLVLPSLCVHDVNALHFRPSDFRIAISAFSSLGHQSFDVIPACVMVLIPFTFFQSCASVPLSIISTPCGPWLNRSCKIENTEQPAEIFLRRVLGIHKKHNRMVFSAGWLSIPDIGRTLCLKLLSTSVPASISFSLRHNKRVYTLHFPIDGTDSRLC